MWGRFWIKIDKTDNCWNWNAGLNNGGYGSFNMCGKVHTAHRASWMLLKGDIPDGLVIDHLCRNRKCVNPDHLEIVTTSENNRRKPFCRNGHERKPENAYVIPKTGAVDCKACRRDSQRRFRANKQVQ